MFLKNQIQVPILCHYSTHDLLDHSNDLLLEYEYNTLTDVHPIL